MKEEVRPPGGAAALDLQKFPIGHRERARSAATANVSLSNNRQ